MRVGSLFTGIGGLDLGLQRAGFEIAWQVEIDPYCRAVLGQHWQEVQRFEDVRECGAHNLSAVDVLAGGFPCQDISTAGKRSGIEGERSGLWREFARIIAEIRPCYVLIENVAALLYANKTCNGEPREAAIATVLRDLADIGYDAEWRVLSAAEFGAPHLRKRVFIVAYDPDQRGRTRRAEPKGQQGQANTHSTGAAEVGNSPGRGCKKRLYTTRIHAELDAPGAAMADATSQGRAAGGNTGRVESSGKAFINDAQHGGEVLADTDSTRLQEWDGSKPEQEQGAAIDECGGHQGQTESRMGGIFDGISAWMDAIEQRWPAGPGEEQEEWEPPRVIQGKLKGRVSRLKGLGNACLPQIAEAIGRAIRKHEEER